ncbi:BTAD domain-containing putative transcriptional regulator [Nonomuraea diastatica]|uniref:LysM peptidoglycan-binding domain-containing protein n=1 Tax=Nonomuraea diastatica TaxID=1848329 RepID=A0A4R4W5E5_9ACTN|nr:BTAD domain-containing putative transcriptional regulator [Nonomuraea diastatica]TDD13161.1 LysM peptidoglycan-binding domain-containing protein [Nonomuraea diastatica]
MTARPVRPRQGLTTMMQGLTALVILVCLIAGGPVALYVLAGSPLPTSLPSLQEIVSALSRPDDGTLLLAALKIIGWMAWGSFTTAVLLEVAARLRGRASATRVPGLGAMQRLAAHLITAIAVALGSPAVAFAATPPPTISATALTDPGMAAPPTILGLERAQAEHVVKPGECLWRIAKEVLGDGNAYRKIVNLNLGHTMTDGRVFTDPAEIHPGWKLRMPPDQQPRADRTEPSTSQQHEGHDEAIPPFDQPHRTATPGSTPSSTPSAIVPTAATSTTSPVPSSVVLSPHPDEGASTDLAVEAVDVGLFASGMLAGGIVTRLAMFRHAQRQHRRTGRRIRLPDQPRVQDREQRLRRSATPDSANDLRAAMRVLAGTVRRDALAMPDIVGVHVTSHSLEVLLGSRPERAPEPFRNAPDADGMAWRLDTDGHAEVVELAGLYGHGDPLPGLFTAGRTHTGGYLLVDLERLGLSACYGPADLVDQVLCTAATEAAANPWSGWFDALLVGCDDLEAFNDRVHTCSDIDEALALLELRASELQASLETPARRTTGDVRERRLRNPDADEWRLTILVSRVIPSPAQMRRLAGLSAGKGGIAALVAADEDTARLAPSRIKLSAGAAPQMTLEAVGLTVHPEAMPPEFYADIAALFTTAADLDDVPADAPPYPADRRVFPLTATASSTAAVPAEEADASPVASHSQPSASSAEPECALHVLGPIELKGSLTPLQGKQLELVVALALNPSGLSNIQLATLLGSDPDHPKPQDSLRQLITRTRRALGPASEDSERIVYDSRSKIYRVHAITLDWALFGELIARGAEHGLDGRDDLRAALALVRGRPLDGAYYWWVDTPLLECMRAETVDAAELLAGLELQADHPQWAARAARTGLSADPTAEQLWRWLMRAEHEMGNTAGVHETWHKCLDAINDVSPDGEPHPSTTQVYHELTGRADAPWPSVEFARARH